MKIGDGALRMRGRGEDRPLVVGEHLQPRLKIGGVIRARFQFGRDAEIGAKETTAEFCNQFFAGALAAVLAVADEIAADAMCWRRPVRFMPISA